MLKKWICLALCLLLVGSVALAENELTPTEGIVIPVIDNLKKFDIPDNEAMAFVKDMKTGWVLGNTFDAFNGETRLSKGGLDMEKSWVGVMTSRDVITAVKAAGFNAVRIPVSWHNHVDEQNQIDPAWMARVREVTEWVLDEGMYAIVNVHHDNYPDFFYPDSTHYDSSASYLSSVWRQMAECFADCDEHLILESMNEPRLTNTEYEWNWQKNQPACKDAADCINRLNQLFVDTVRATGGQNATRYLCVPAYDASPWYACDEAFQLPKDSAENRIIVAAHAYTPYNFALNLNSNDQSFSLEDAGKKAEISQFMNGLYERFVSKGIPVLMDEYGALEKGENLQDRVNFAAYYIAAASARNLTCFWWDNHLFRGNGERFGLLNRKNASWTYPDIVLAIQNNCLFNRAD